MNGHPKPRMGPGDQGLLMRKGQNCIISHYHPGFLQHPLWEDDLRPEEKDQNFYSSSWISKGPRETEHPV